MLTQAIRRWLNKLFGWWPWKNPPEPEYAHAGSPLNKSITQEPVLRSTSDGTPPQAGTGAAPQIVGQGETSCSTIDEWPESIMQPLPPPSTPIEKTELPSVSLPTTPPIETTTTSPENMPTAKGKGETPFPDTPPPTPTPEQQLQFLHYLVKRGIVNEGFAEGQVPEQYKK